MGTDLIVPEPDVLVAAAVFLIQREAVPYQFSVAAGKGIETSAAISRLRDAFSSVGHTPNFTGNGADILAVSETEWWAVECKGVGAGAPQTQRNNFDRALASVVSYYEDGPPGATEKHKNAKVCLGLALPATPAYLRELRRRVRQPLRTRLNLWVLLYEPEEKSIRPIAPHESI
jgi:hypothetical protein